MPETHGVRLRRFLLSGRFLGTLQTNLAGENVDREAGVFLHCRHHPLQFVAKEEVEKGLKLGADDYMIKAHFTPDEIIEKVQKLLKEKDI